MPEPLLFLKDVAVSFGRQELFRDISFQLTAGDLIVITGESGVGKSTLLKAIMGDVEFSGSIAVCGEPVNGRVPPRPRGIVFVPQHAHLWEHLTVMQNLLLARRTLHRDTRTQARNACMRILETLEVDGLAKRYPFRLSGGEQHRVALARALAVDAQIYLFDEPSTHLDRKRIRVVAEVISILGERERALVVATHDESLVSALGSAPFELGRQGLELRGDANL